jgi:DNA primase
MAGRIPQHFIDELLSRIDVVDIVDAYVPLKKAGKNHQACCPFHDEKTPSFTVSQQKQFYHCFGCGANGSAISFLMEYLHMDFVEAIEDLASRAGMEIPREAIQVSQSSNQSNELYELMEMTTAFYSRQLRKHPQADSVINYLKGRGISGDIAAEFELGFAPPGWDNLITELGGSDNASKRLLKIGAIIENDRGGYYDRFRNRLIFPIRDQRGRAIGLGGRVLDDDKPKYLNSPETPIFHKGRELYGLYQARKALKDIDSLFVVEGYMDVIALAQYGVRNVVASLGTAATPEHMEKMFRITNTLIFCFDGDEAGKKAAWRGLENALPLLRDGRQIYFVFLPDGEDPDTFIRSNGKEAFLSEDLRTVLSEYLFSSLSKGVDLDTPEGRALMMEKSLPHLFNLPVGTLRNILVQELSKIIHYDINLIEAELAKRTGKENGTTVFKRLIKKDQGIDSIRLLVRSLLHSPSFANELESTEIENLAVFSSPGIIFLCELIQFIKDRPNINLSNILENWRNTKFENRLKELSSEEEFFNETQVDSDWFTESVSQLIKINCREFDSFAIKNKPSELTEDEKTKYRGMQKSELDT